MTASTVVSNVKKIGILRSGALGDFIVILPAVLAIRNTYPNSEIILIGRPWLKEFLNDKRTPIGRFIEVPVLKGIREEFEKDEDTTEVHEFLQRMKEEIVKSEEANNNKQT